MQKTILLMFAFLCLIGCKQETTIAINATDATIGFKVPNLAFKQLLNDSDTSSSLYDYKQDLIILDFWATWCGPCISSFDKMSGLQEKYPSKLKIIAITDEEESRIITFLKNRPQKFAMALDTDNSLNEYFKHRTIPHYVILDKNKTVKAIVDAAAITTENIEALIAGQDIVFEEKKEDLTFDYNKTFAKNEIPPVYQSTLLPYNPDAPGVSNPGAKKGNRLFAYNMTLKAMLRMAYQYKYTRVIENIKHPELYTFTPENRYCYEMIFPEYLKERRLALMQEEIKAFSGLEARIERRTTDVYLLQKIPGTTISIPVSAQLPDPNGFVRYGEGITLQGQPMSDLANYYEEVMQLPIVDITGYSEVYDIAVKWYEENPKQGLAELTKYGLELKKAKRPIDFLIISD